MIKRVSRWKFLGTSRKAVLRAGLAAALLMDQTACSFGFGSFFAQKSENVTLHMPGARAFICRSGIREDLILQVGFFGSAEEFAWVVPVPARPAVRLADPGVFDELRRIFNPRIIPGPGTRVSSEPTPAEQAPPPVQIRDVAVIAPSEPGALVRWLRSNKFEIPPPAYGIIQDYTKRGWYFITARVRTSPAPVARWLQPLWIAFPSQRAVLPARLSSLNSRPLVAQLFVAADVVVQAPGFTEVYRTASPLRTKYKLNEFPLFFQIVTRDCKLTELRATLEPKQMESDIAIVPR